MKRLFKGILKLSVCTLKLDPVKYAAYELLRQVVKNGAKLIAKSTKNTMDDKLVNQIEIALKK